MSKSLSTFNSKRYFLTVIGAFFFFFWISLILYLCFPKMFYWRAWEYFDDILYSKTFTGPLKWDWYEKGDLSRKFSLSYQNKWKTQVSADEEGFRSVPIRSDNYPILVAGDSQTWGCGLDDDQTLPWKLAEKLQIPVYNGGRCAFSLENILSNPTLAKSKLIVEIVSFHHLDLNFPEGFTLSEYKPLKRDGKPHQSMYQSLFAQLMKKTKVFSKDPRRFFLPYKVNQYLSLSRCFNSLFIRKSLDHYGVDKKGYLFNLSEGEQAILAKHIQKRSQDLQSLGYHYLFVAVPPKAFIGSETLLPSTIDCVNGFFASLKDLNVDAIDLTTPFLSQKDRKELYLLTDLHWSEIGTEIAAKIIAQHVADTRDIWDSER